MGWSKLTTTVIYSFKFVVAVVRVRCHRRSPKCRKAYWGRPDTVMHARQERWYRLLLEGGDVLV